MAVTVSQLRALSLSGEFDAYSDDQLQPFLDDTALFMDSTAWGDRYDRGRLFLAAHFVLDAACSADGSAGMRPAVTSEKLGPAARTYAQGSAASSVMADLRLHGTRYGRRFAALYETLPLTPLVVHDGTISPERWDY